MATIFKCDNCGDINPETDAAAGFIYLTRCDWPPEGKGRRELFLCHVCFESVVTFTDRALSIAADTA